MFEKPDENKENHQSRSSFDELNAIIKNGETVETDFVFGLPEFKPDPVIPSIHDWSYYTFDETETVRHFVEDFLTSISSVENTEERIKRATTYVLEHIQWIRKEPTRSVSELVKGKAGSCTVKSVLLAYLAHKLGLKSYVLAGYARNVSIDNCPELKTRNRAYKAGSPYPKNLFNLPLEPKDKSIEEDVGHAWVGIQTDKGMVYADPTTGLVSTTPAERQIFSTDYKALPIAHPDFIDGVELTREHQYSYLDLDFDEPVQRIRAKVSRIIPEEWKAGSTLVLEGPEDKEVKLVSPLKGFDIISRSRAN